MSDPVGLIGGNGGVRPNAAAGAGARAGGEGGAAFKDVLLENLKQVNKLQADATRAVEDLQAGRRGDVEGVIQATQKADLAFQSLQAVRNKVVEAYQEIQQVRI
ncbi:MAG: flagellar hook-basal body complex protein FliE [Phycisphaerales bacterium]|nr:MAG: flagellar hook-basal body complex protein FliE [Phycisphaerales bacterium]